MIGMLFVMLFLVGILPTKAHAEGWVQEENGSWYYLNQASDGTQGTMKTGWFKDTDGNWYYLNPVSDGTQGAMKTGWFTDPQDGHLYYLDPKTGAMVTGNVQNDNV